MEYTHDMDTHAHTHAIKEPCFGALQRIRGRKGSSCVSDASGELRGAGIADRGHDKYRYEHINISIYIYIYIERDRERDARHGYKHSELLLSALQTRSAMWIQSNSSEHIQTNNHRRYE